MSEVNTISTRVFTFIGRVHPERYNYAMHNMPGLMFKSDDGRVASYQFRLQGSQMCIQVKFNHGDVEIFDLKNSVKSMACAALDSLGFTISEGLVLEIVSCIDPDGVFHVFDTVSQGFGSRARERPRESKRLSTCSFLTRCHPASSALPSAISTGQ